MVRGLKEFNEPLDIIKERLSSTSTHADIDSITAQLKEYTREAGTILTKLETDSKAIDDHYNSIKLDAQKKRKRDDEDSAAVAAPATTAATPTPTTTTATPTGQSEYKVFINYSDRSQISRKLLSILSDLRSKRIRQVMHDLRTKFTSNPLTRSLKNRSHLIYLLLRRYPVHHARNLCHQQLRPRMLSMMIS